MLVILEMSPDTAIDKLKTEDNKDLKLSHLGQQINKRVSQEHKIEEEGSSKMYVLYHYLSVSLTDIIVPDLCIRTIPGMLWSCG